jgi:hypothetical protein
MNQTHSSDGRNLLWIGFDATLRDDEPEQHTSRDPKNALFGVEFYAILLELLEGFFKVSHELVNLFGLDYDVIHVASTISPMRSPKHLSIHRWYVTPVFFSPNSMLT